MEVVRASPSTASSPTSPSCATELLALADYHLTRDTDTEVIMHYLSHELRGDERPDLVEVFRNLSRKFDGAYNIVFLNAMGDMVVLRDPKGFRPLCYAQDGPLFAAASESVPLLNLGFRDVHSLEPGEMIVIQDNQVRRERFAPRQPTAALLLRVDLLRQRRQHARRPQRLPDAGARWARSWPGRSGSSAGCRSTTTRSSCRCPTPARPPPTRWPSSWACRRSRG